ncbi:hypothetical protein BT69DRAFT_1344910, partial [Atractiella rhizophila]
MPPPAVAPTRAATRYRKGKGATLPASDTSDSENDDAAQVQVEEEPERRIGGDKVVDLTVPAAARVIGQKKKVAKAKVVIKDEKLVEEERRRFDE